MKVGIPALQELGVVCLDELLDPVEFLSAEATTILHPHRDKPEFGNLFVTLNMHVGWLITVPRIEKASVWTNTQNGWHNDSFFWGLKLLTRSMCAHRYITLCWGVYASKTLSSTHPKYSMSQPHVWGKRTEK
jgi:hypothetical protein